MQVLLLVFYLEEVPAVSPSMSGHNADHSRKIGHVLYNCSASRPKIEGKTNEGEPDLQVVEQNIGVGNEEHSNLDLFSLEMFENIAYMMAKHADPQIPDGVKEWLDGFNTFSIYQVLPQLIELWGVKCENRC